MGKISPPSATIIKENSATFIGGAIVLIFGLAVVFLLHLGSLLFTKFNGVSNADFASFVRDALNPFLKECATTLGTIFGSTLGFVLGYYFKEASNSSQINAASTTNVQG